MHFGRIGVLLFFVISGATLFVDYRGLRGQRETLAFLVKRFFRVWSAFAVSLVVFMIVIPVFQHFYPARPQGHWIEVHVNADNCLYDRHWSWRRKRSCPQDFMVVPYVGHIGYALG